MSWEDNEMGTRYAREIVTLEKNVRDLQEQLNAAHKRIAELSAQNRNKVVVLKSVREIVEQELVGP